MPSNPILVVTGTVGSGKGTQTELLVKEFGVPSVSAGELFRAQLDQPTDLGKRVKAIYDVGGLMTIDIWVEVVGDYLDHADLSKGYILEGVIRSLEQAEHFGVILKERSLDEPWVIAIELSDDKAMERMMNRGRIDDTDAQARSRLAWSHNETLPLIERYRKLGKLIEVNGDQPIETVHADIMAALEKIGIIPERA